MNIKNRGNMKRNPDQWEERFRVWAGGPGDTELQKCENAENMIKKAIKADSKLALLNIEIFAQGSFKNITNIPEESDIDVSVCFHEAFYFDLPNNANIADYGLVIGSSSYNYDDYKKQVNYAISNYFGKNNITCGKKAIRIHSNTYRVDADVVPNFEYRLYSSPNLFRQGVRFFSEDGVKVTNWPKQHTEEGIRKNSRTGRRFKRVTRILKILQVEMLADGSLTKRLPSFFIECLAFNALDGCYSNDQYYIDVRNVLFDIYSKINNNQVSEWTEVNDIKYLFGNTQPWTTQDALNFSVAACKHIGLI